MRDVVIAILAVGSGLGTLTWWQWRRHVSRANDEGVALARRMVQLLEEIRDLLAWSNRGPERGPKRGPKDPDSPL